MLFQEFAALINKNWGNLLQTQAPLFRVDVSPELLVQTYMSAFSEAENPVYRTRRTYDCANCNNFIRNIGNVVAVIDGNPVSIWDTETEIENPKYQKVAATMAALIYSAPIKDAFFTMHGGAGAPRTNEVREGGEIHAWFHFYGAVPQQYVVPEDKLANAMHKVRSVYEAWTNSRAKATLDGIDTVLDLIAQESLYRADDKKEILEAVRKLLEKPNTVTENWLLAVKKPEAVLRFLTTSLGDLVIALSEGEDLEAAVGKYESKVASGVYQRPKALVTKRMLDDARAELKAAGLESALYRRFAVLEDLEAKNLIYLDRRTSTRITASPLDNLVAESKTTVKGLDSMPVMDLDDFVANVLPRTMKLEILLENAHANRMVSLMTAEDASARQLFSWDNPFSWTYRGEVTDAIKARVKAAGGSVEGFLCCRLAWNYTDDLDLYMTEPNGHTIFYGIRGYTSVSGGKLDVDANGLDGVRDDPVENIFYAQPPKIRGIYQLYVRNFDSRSSGRGFQVQVESPEGCITLTYEGAPPVNQRINVADIHWDGNKITVTPYLASENATQMVWGLQTNDWHRVEAVMASPNMWNGTQGLSHTFFMLENCKNEETHRAVYPEFLRSDLKPFRKAMEYIGAKIQASPSGRQLSGVGFSTGAKEVITCRVTGATQRIIKVRI